MQTTPYESLVGRWDSRHMGQSESANEGAGFRLMKRTFAMVHCIDQLNPQSLADLYPSFRQGQIR